MSDMSSCCSTEETQAVLAAYGLDIKPYYTRTDINRAFGFLGEAVYALTAFGFIESFMPHPRRPSARVYDLATVVHLCKNFKPLKPYLRGPRRKRCPLSVRGLVAQP